MREVDRRSKNDRRAFLQGAAAAVPTVAIAASAGVGIENAWAEDATALTPATLKTLVKVGARCLSARYSRRQLLHRRGQAMGWQGGEGSGGESLINDGVNRLDQDARDRHKVAYVEVPWEADRVVLLQGIEQTDFFKKLRGDLVVSLYNQKELWPKFGYEGSSAEHGGYIKRGFADIDWLPKV